MNKKNTHNMFRRTFIVSVLPVLVILLAILVSCKSSHSVRDIKSSRDPSGNFIPQTVKVKIPEIKAAAMVKGLFMQSRYSNIELPYIEGSETGPRVVSEEVTFTNAEEIRSTNGENKATNLSEVQHLNEVVVTAKSRFTPEQDGRVGIDFIVKVPKAMLSSNFRITVSPKVLHNDSIVPLDEVVIKGEGFAQKQKQDYLDYDNYIKSIVDESAYDSVFVDYDGVRDDILFQQEFYYGQYHKDWKIQAEYEEWKANKSDAEALIQAQQTGLDKKTYHENVRKARQEAMKEIAKGKDTTGFFARYMNKVMKPEKIKQTRIKVEQRDDFRLDFYKEYSKRAQEQVLRDWAMGKDTAGGFARYMKGFDRNMQKLVLEGEDMSKIPEKFRELYKSGRTMKKIENQAFTPEDSVEIAKHRYMVEDIALNEMKKERREEKRDEMIVFPYETHTRVDTVVQTNSDFVYYYSQTYPVVPGLRRLRLTIGGTVDAIDRSRFLQPQSDTLSYFISSLSQLADISYETKKITEHKNAETAMSIYPKYQAKTSKFNISYSDNRTQIDTVVNSYNTLLQRTRYEIDSIDMKVSTSLDGTWDQNEKASLNRANELRSILASSLGISEYVIKVRPGSENWNDLVKAIVKRDNLPNKQAILDMLTTALNPDQTEDDIKKKYPEDYRIIKEQIYPMLNKVDLVFNMTLPGMTEDVATRTEKRPNYDKAMQLLQDRKYWEALEILSEYGDFNTALCLVCMGYNQQAFDLLNKLDQTGNTEYLLAILAIRTGDESKAIAHLKKACELDSTKAYRAPLDPEVAALVRKYNLQNELNIAADGAAMDIQGTEGTAAAGEGVMIEDSTQIGK